MAIKRNNEEVKAIGVSRVKEFTNGDITFDLVVNDVSIYGCKIVEGKNGDFVSFPSRKGKNGKYYSYAYVKLTASDVDAIESLISTML